MLPVDRDNLLFVCDDEALTMVSIHVPACVRVNNKCHKPWTLLT